MISLVVVAGFCRVVRCLEEGFVADLLPALAHFDRLIHGHEEGRKLGQEILGGLLHHISRYCWTEYRVIMIIYTKRDIFHNKVRFFLECYFYLNTCMYICYMYEL